MRTWPALVVGRLKPDPTDAPPPYVGADFSRPDTTDLVQAALVDHDVEAIDESTPDTWRVFFATDAARDAAAAVLHRAFPAMHIEPLDVPDDDWAAKSQASLRAITVGALTIAPPWDVREMHKAQGARPNAQAIEIVIQPSMGFGTGHHATTRLCLTALQRLDLRGRSAIDVGTGSGVLAIACSLLGAAPVVGIDDDPDAIQAARENLSLNPTARVTFDVIDLRATKVAASDFALANLTGGLLASAAITLQELVAPGGRLILSGFMEHEEEDVLRGFDGYELDDRSQEDEWLSVTLRRPAVL